MLFPNSVLLNVHRKRICSIGDFSRGVITLPRCFSSRHQEKKREREREKRKNVKRAQTNSNIAKIKNHQRRNQKSLIFSSSSHSPHKHTIIVGKLNLPYIISTIINHEEI
jgi:hypothetical protein